MVPQDVQTARLTNIAPLCDPGHMGMKRGSGATSLGVTELAGFAARARFPRSPSPPIPAVSERQASQWNAGALWGFDYQSGVQRFYGGQTHVGQLAVWRESRRLPDYYLEME